MKRYWLAFVLVTTLSFAVLGWVGVRVYREAPPLPERVLTTDGREVIPAGAITRGQNVWQAMGGMQVGSVWGHGSYVAPDWSADWLHREAVFMLEEWAQSRYGSSYEQLGAPERAALRAQLGGELRENTFDAQTRTLSISPARARAYASNSAHFADVFSNGRAEYAIPAGAQSGESELRALNAFIFWTAWACTTLRPGDTASRRGRSSGCRGAATGSATIAGRFTASWRSPSGTWWAPACSAS